MLKSKNMKKFIAISISLIFAGCASSALLTPSQMDVDRVITKYEGYSLADLNHGKVLYEKHCGNCHGLKKPASKTEAEWELIVPRMVKKVNKKEDITMDAATQESILRYVITMSEATSKH
jgi:mono/diheme cytochrome c family protein